MGVSICDNIFYLGTFRQGHYKFIFVLKIGGLYKLQMFEKCYVKHIGGIDQVPNLIRIKNLHK